MKITKNLEQWTQEWLNLRKWVITWTKLKWVTWWKQAQLTQMYTLLAEEHLDEEELSSWEIIERWNALESVAKFKYEGITWHKVEEVGFIQVEDWLWLSPDGIIETWENVYWRAIEIKCPRGKNYVKYLLEDVIPKEYLTQVINYFIVMKDLEKLDFIIYNPDVIKGIPEIHIIKVTREDLQKDIGKAQDKLIIFKKGWDGLKDNLLEKWKSIKTNSTQLEK